VNFEAHIALEDPVLKRDQIGQSILSVKDRFLRELSSEAGKRTVIDLE